MGVLNYYFTFGTNEKFPYQNGYVKVRASNRSEAVEKFNAKYPPIDKSGLVNCAFIYNQEEFDKANLNVKANIPWCASIFNYCHDEI